MTITCYYTPTLWKLEGLSIERDYQTFPKCFIEMFDCLETFQPSFIGNEELLVTFFNTVTIVIATDDADSQNMDNIESTQTIYERKVVYGIRRNSWPKFSF